MKKASKSTSDSDMLPEYQFKGGTRGRFAARYAQGTNVVLLEPEIAKSFPDSEAVNRALRLLLEIAKKAAKK